MASTSPLLIGSTVLFFSRPRSEGWPHHGRTFSIYLCPLSFWLTLPRRVLSTSWCCPSRPCVAFLAFVHLALFLALSLSPRNSLVSSWCDHSMLASLLGSTGSGHFPDDSHAGISIRSSTMLCYCDKNTNSCPKTCNETVTYWVHILSHRAILLLTCRAVIFKEGRISLYYDTFPQWMVFANFVTSFSTMDLCVSWTGQLDFELSAKICIGVV